MRTYIIHGSWALTGTPVNLKISATDAEAATARLGRLGIDVASIEPAGEDGAAEGWSGYRAAMSVNLSMQRQ